MGKIKEWIRNAVDGRGKSPGSLEALKQSRQRRAAPAQDPAPVPPPAPTESTFSQMRAAQYSAANPSPLPRAPSPAPLYGAAPAPGSAAEFFQTMQMYEGWKDQIWQNEQRKRTAIEEAIRARLEKEFESTGEAAPGLMDDPIIREAAGLILESWKSGRNTSPPAQEVQAGGTSPATPPAIAQPAPSNAAAPTITPEKAEEIADKIEDKMPQQCKDLRAGKITRERALQMIQAGGATPEDAELILDAILRVEDL